MSDGGKIGAGAAVVLFFTVVVGLGWLSPTIAFLATSAACLAISLRP